MNTTFEPIAAKSVLPNYSWDHGIPFVDNVETFNPIPTHPCYDKYFSIWNWINLSFDSLSPNQLTNAAFWKLENIGPTLWSETIKKAIHEKKWSYDADISQLPPNTYVGFAPMVFIQLSSEVSDLNYFNVATTRTVNFGDYYNLENNEIVCNGTDPAVFCHHYIMPGFYPIKIKQTEYISTNNVFPKNSCFEKHCIPWKWSERMTGYLPHTTWVNTSAGQTYEKKWKKELCEDAIEIPTDIYIENVTNNNTNLSRAWQWDNFNSGAENAFDRDLTWEETEFGNSTPLIWNDIGSPCVDLRTERGDIFWQWQTLTDLFDVGTIRNRKITWFDTASATSYVESCLDKHCIEWEWSKNVKGEEDLLLPDRTWHNTQTDQLYEKQWKSELDLNCGEWSESLRTWERTESDDVYKKTWQTKIEQHCESLQQKELLEKPINKPLKTTWRQTSNLCNEASPKLLEKTEAVDKEVFVKVLEIPPIAYLHVSQPENVNQRISPVTVRLSPRYVQCGSFPIEKIVWDLGDGSPLIEQTRWSPTLSSPFVFTGALTADSDDPRNYDVIHNYSKTQMSDYCFYPSITAYASNTYASDCASAIVGPIKPKLIETFKIMQNELEYNGSVLLGQVDNSICAWKTE